MRISFFTKAVGYQRRNVLKIFSNTMIAIYEECDNLKLPTVGINTQKEDDIFPIR